MADDKPAVVYEDGTTGDRFLIYGTDNGPCIDIRYAGDTLWMTQAQMAQLFGRDVSTISRHIASVYDEGELDEESSLQKMQTTSGRPAIIYNLDVVISVGYRVSSAQATLFRRWATGVLAQFAQKGFVIDTQRLKRPESRDRFAELRDIIRDIRSDEANVYRELRSICAMCQDYDPQSEKWLSFFRNTQAKLLYAVTAHTPSEIIVARADVSAPNMGLIPDPDDLNRSSGCPQTPGGRSAPLAYAAEAARRSRGVHIPMSSTHRDVVLPTGPTRTSERAMSAYPKTILGTERYAN